MFPKDERFIKRYQQQMADIKKMNRQSILNEYRTRLFLYLSAQGGVEKRVDSEFFDIEVDITEKNPIFENRSINYFSTEKIAVYTSNYGANTPLLEPLTIPDNCDFYVFTDQEVPQHSVWKKIDAHFASYDLIGAPNKLKNQFVKLHAHLYFSDYPYSLYMDSNIQLMTDPTECIERMNTYGVIFHDHYRVDCAYIEIEHLHAQGLLSDKQAARQKAYLEKEGLPENYGFLECPVIFREHQNEIGQALMEEWWQELIKWGDSEEVSLPLVLYRRGIRTLELAGLGYDLYSNYAFRKVHQRADDEDVIAYRGKVTT